jgi:hypothetical protein
MLLLNRLFYEIFQGKSALKKAENSSQDKLKNTSTSESNIFRLVE